MTKLVGGSQSEPVRTFTHGFFHSGVKATQFRVARQEFLRFLPAFDPSKEGTSEYETSYISYRDQSSDPQLDDDTKTPAFNSWYFVVRGYAFYGHSMSTFLSPLSGVPSDRVGGLDPLNDVRNHLFKTDDPMLKSLTENQGPKAQAPAPKARVFMLANVLLMTDFSTRATENQVGIFTGAALTDLKDKLARRTGRTDPVISSDWEDFLYGDITHPTQGLAATIKETPMDSNPNIRFAGIHFSDIVGRLDGHQTWELEPDSTEGRDALTGRYEIGDADKVTKVWSYDQILDLIVEEGVIPYETIERACGQYVSGGIPAKSSTAKGATYSIPSQVSESEKTDEPTIESSAPRPPSPQGATPVAQTVKTPAKSSVMSAVESSETSGSDSSEEEKTPNQSEDEMKSRYEELAAKFRENPNNLESKELPEFFDLCSKLGVSPQ